MTVDATTKELVADCLTRISSGDAGAAFDLASAFMSHVDAKDIGINLAVVEALATLAKVQGSPDAAAFLDGQWPEMQGILRKRWRRAGFADG
jgi:hypothetical protein